MSPCEPATDSEDDRLAAERAHAITNLWFLDPALRGRYPDAFPFNPAVFMKIRQDDMDLVRAPFDFIGINLYYRTIVSATTLSERFSDRRFFFLPARMGSGQKGPKTDIGWEVWPRSIYDMVMRITRDYNRPVIEITESGCAYNDAPDATGAVNDTRRIEYHGQYLGELARAIRDGADVRSYHAWSLLDNFEWAEGLGQRFGLLYVDYKTQKRTVKKSGEWYARVAAQNALPPFR
jgi:beta-glucosidase